MKINTDHLGVVATGLGAIPLGSSAAFLALASSFIILTSVSYAIPFAANMLSGRKYFPRGPFHLGKAGYVINGLAVLFIVLFDIMFCFRKSLFVPKKKNKNHGHALMRA